MISLFVLLLGQTGGKGGGWDSMIFLVLIVAVFYFFMIRPQLKKTKDQKKYIAELKKGDKIITIGGIHGKIAEINDKTFLIEVEGGNKLRIQREAISMDASNLIGSENKT